MSHTHVMQELHGINLNLLTALDALLLERHVGRAAHRAGVTQSAMSHSLRQLRDLLDDPLLVRSGQRMLPTPRAEALAPLLREGIRSLERVLQVHEEPSPSTFTQNFTLAIQDVPAALLLPELSRRLREEAPLASLALVAPSPALGAALERGQVHAAFVPPVNPPPNIRSEMLSSQDTSWVVLGREDHPAFQGELDLDGYCATPHAMMTITGVGLSWVDEVLARMGRARTIALRMPYGLAAPSALLGSDLITTTPAIVSRVFTDHFPIRAAPLPLEPPPSGMLLAWHERYENEPPYRWFRELLREIAMGY